MEHESNFVPIENPDSLVYQSQSNLNDKTLLSTTKEFESLLYPDNSRQATHINTGKNIIGNLGNTYDSDYGNEFGMTEDKTMIKNDSVMAIKQKYRDIKKIDQKITNIDKERDALDRESMELNRINNKNDQWLIGADSREGTLAFDLTLTVDQGTNVGSTMQNRKFNPAVAGLGRRVGNTDTKPPPRGGRFDDTGELDFGTLDQLLDKYKDIEI